MKDKKITEGITKKEKLKAKKKCEVITTWGTIIYCTSKTVIIINRLVAIIVSL